MNFGDFKKTVLAFVRRTTSSVVVDGQDMLSVAINAARKYSERMYDFEHCRVLGKLELNQNGASVNNIRTPDDQPLAVKSIKAAYLKDTKTGQLFPIDIISRAQQFVLSDLDGISRTTLVRFGELLYLLPPSSDMQTVWLDVIRWLPDYVNDSDTDFLLTHCTDYMVLRTVQMLNFFLKEDVRIPVSSTLLEAAWKSVRVWDTNLVQGTTSNSMLD